MESRFWDKNVGKVLQIFLWIIAFYVAWYVVPKGYEKLVDIPGTMEFFISLGIPGSLASVSGIVELVGPLMMLVPRLAFYGAVPVTINMLVASYSVGWNTWPLTLAVLSLIVVIIARPSFLRKKKQITKISI
ncbi:MAG: DoxX family protein [Candidatus Altimarinota bacterium]